jgi:DNA-binding response OmpR family regulator
MDPELHILVVDDEPAITALMALVLAHSGCEVIEAGGGLEAITIARQKRPEVVMLDVMMPDLDGREACRIIRMDQDLEGVAVILFSSADERDVHWAAAGADAFLQKPFGIRELSALVRRVAADRGHPSG